MKGKAQKLWGAICGFVAAVCLTMGLGIHMSSMTTSVAAASSSTPTVTMIGGASARKTGEPGIKFTARIDNYSSNNGYEYGMLILPEAAWHSLGWTNETDFIAVLNEKNVSYANKICTPYEGSDGNVYIAYSLTDLYEENYSMSFFGVAYTLKDGAYDYSDVNLVANARSIAYVAQMALKYENNLTSEQKLALQSYAGNGYIVEEDYLTGNDMSFEKTGERAMKYIFKTSGGSVSQITKNAYAGGSRVSFKYYIPAGTNTSWWGIAYNTANEGLSNYDAADASKAKVLDASNTVTGAWTDCSFVLPDGGPYYLYFGSDDLAEKWLVNGENSYMLIDNFTVANASGETLVKETFNSGLDASVFAVKYAGAVVDSGAYEGYVFENGEYSVALDFESNIGGNGTSFITKYAYKGGSTVSFNYYIPEETTVGDWWAINYDKNGASPNFWAIATGTTSAENGGVNPGAVKGEWTKFSFTLPAGDATYYLYFSGCSDSNAWNGNVYVDDFTVTTNGVTVTDDFDKDSLESIFSNNYPEDISLVKEPTVVEQPYGIKIAMDSISADSSSPSFITKNKYISDGTLTVSFDYYMPSAPSWWGFYWTTSNTSANIYAIDNNGNCTANNNGRGLPTVQNAWSTATVTIPAGEWYFYIAGARGEWNGGHVLIDNVMINGEAYESFNRGFDAKCIFANNTPSAITLAGGKQEEVRTDPVFFDMANASTLKFSGDVSDGTTEYIDVAKVAANANLPRIPVGESGYMKISGTTASWNALPILLTPQAGADVVSQYSYLEFWYYNPNGGRPVVAGNWSEVATGADAQWYKVSISIADYYAANNADWYNALSSWLPFLQFRGTGGGAYTTVYITSIYLTNETVAEESGEELANGLFFDMANASTLKFSTDVADGTMEYIDAADVAANVTLPPIPAGESGYMKLSGTTASWNALPIFITPQASASVVSQYKYLEFWYYNPNGGKAIVAGNWSEVATGADVQWYKVSILIADYYAANNEGWYDALSSWLPFLQFRGTGGGAYTTVYISSIYLTNEITEAEEQQYGAKISMDAISADSASPSFITKNAYTSDGTTTVTFDYYMPSAPSWWGFYWTTSNTNANIYAIDNNGNCTSDNNGKGMPTVQNAWSTVSITIPAGKWYFYIAGARGEWNGSYVLIDNVMINGVDGAVFETFNNGFGEDCIFANNTPSAIALVQGLEEAEVGEYSLKLDFFNSFDYTATSLITKIPFAGGSTVSFKFLIPTETTVGEWWAICWDTNKNASNFWAVANGPVAGNGGIGLSLTKTTEWVEYSFTLPDDNQMYYLYFTGYNGWHGHIYIDDFSVTKNGETVSDNFNKGVEESFFAINTSAVTLETVETPVRVDSNAYEVLKANGSLFTTFETGGYAYYASAGSLDVSNLAPSMLFVEGSFGYSFEGTKEFAIWFGNEYYLLVSPQRIALYNDTTLIKMLSSTTTGTLRLAITAYDNTTNSRLNISLNGGDYIGFGEIGQPTEMKVVALGGTDKVSFENFSFTTYKRSVSSEVPIYFSTDRIDFTAYAYDTDLMMSDEGFQLLADAGFNNLLSILQGRVGYEFNETVTDEQVNILMAEVVKDAENAVALAEEYGMKVTIFNELIYNLERNTDRYDLMQQFADYIKNDAEANDKVSYLLSEAFAGHVLADEPNFNKKEKTFIVTTYSFDDTSGEIVELVNAYKRYKAAFPNSNAYINLLPYGDWDESKVNPGNVSIYKEYVQYYVNNIAKDTTDEDGNIIPGTGYISFDYYPLKIDGATKSILETHLWNLEYVAGLCRDNGLELRTYVKSATEDDTTNKKRKIENINDLYMQIYSALAYGSKEVIYYTFADYDDSGIGMVETSLETSNVYNWAVQANNEVLAFSTAYMNFTWKSASYFGASSNQQGLTSAGVYGSISAVSSSASVVVGNFDDADEDYMYGAANAYMVVNYGDPSNGTTASDIAITFNGTPTRALVYENGVARVVTLSSNVLTLSLEVGEGAFVIPLTDNR